MDQLAKGRLPVGRLGIHAFDLPGDLPIDLSDRCIERVPLPKMHLQQKAVMLAQPAMQCVVQRFQRGLDGALGQGGQSIGGQSMRVALAWAFSPRA